MRKQLGAGALAAVATLFVVTSARADDQQVTLRFSHWLPPQHPMAQFAVPEWVNSIEKASNGSIRIQVFPAGQLGNAVDHYDMGRDGLADISWVNAGSQPGRFPLVEALEMPWLYADAAGATRAFDEWYRPLALTEMKDVKVCLLHVLTPSEIHSRKELKTIDDFKGLRVRTSNATQARYFSSLGSVVVPVPAPQARDALEKGVAEAVTFPWQSLMIFGADNQARFNMDLPFAGNGFELIINKTSYDKLSQAQKAVLDAHCNAEWSGQFADVWNKQEVDGRAVLAGKSGHVIYSASDKLKSDLQSAAEPIRKEWEANARKTGVDPSQLWARLVEAMNKYKAN